MLDVTFRPLKDRVFGPLCNFIPLIISPAQVTAAAFLTGISACAAATTSSSTISVILWLCNRALDCLDGALARHRKQASDLGGFIDLFGDFVVYSLIPISCGLSTTASKGQFCHLWLSIATVEASFHINNFVLFYVAATVEKRKRYTKELGLAGDERRTKELTSITMRPALIEGVESGVLFTAMLWKPIWTEALCWLMAGLVGISICQRTICIVSVLD